MAKCRDCWAPIRFVHITTTGRPLPVDAVADEGGNVFARVIAGRLTGRVRTKDEQLPEGWQIWMPHHATCEIKLREQRLKGARGSPGPTAQPALFDIP